MLNIGVIGCGGMGRDHIKRIAERTQGAQVVAVADMVEALAKKGQELAGEGCKIYSDGKDLINDANVDAVFIVSPGFAHKESLLEAIKVGKQIFCEKPLCTTAADCLEVIDAEIKSGKHLIQLGFMRRYDKGYRQVKTAIHEIDVIHRLVDNEVFINCKFDYDINCTVVCEDGAIEIPQPLI